MGNSSTTMHAPSGQHAKYQGSQQSVLADLPHLLRPHRTISNSFEGSKAEKLPGKSLGCVLAEHDIEPWAATTPVREKLEKHAVLVLEGSSPVLRHLQKVSVADGLNLFKSKLGSMRDLDEDAFVKIVSQCYPWAVISQEENDKIITSDAVSVFGFMDSHASKRLSIGEWAGVMAVFFKGTHEEKARALFDLLDEHSKGWLSKEELQQYLIAPVKAMTPSEASPLVPLLVRLCADQLMQSASFTDKSQICCQDFVRWQSKSNDVKDLIDFLAKFVEAESCPGGVEAEVKPALLKAAQFGIGAVIIFREMESDQTSDYFQEHSEELESDQRMPCLQEHFEELESDQRNQCSQEHFVELDSHQRDELLHEHLLILHDIVQRLQDADITEHSAQRDEDAQEHFKKLESDGKNKCLQDNSEGLESDQSCDSFEKQLEEVEPDQRNQHLQQHSDELDSHQGDELLHEHLLVLQDIVQRLQDADSTGLQAGLSGGQIINTSIS